MSNYILTDYGPVKMCDHTELTKGAPKNLNTFKEVADKLSAIDSKLKSLSDKIDEIEERINTLHPSENETGNA